MASQKRIYFDHNANAPILAPARDAVVEVLSHTGNASSVHSEGRLLRGVIERSRRTLAQHFGCEPRQIVFTSGASEAAALALSPRLHRDGEALFASRLYVSEVEHPCVLSGGRFSAGDVEALPVDGHGIVRIDALEAALSGHDHDRGLPMVAVMLANNETGAIQPIGEIAEIVHGHGGLLVVDGVQGLSKLEAPLDGIAADMVFYSAHKIGGPHGAGALVLAGSVAPAPLIRGGGQEAARRAGTENAAAIAGFAAAAQAASNYPRQQIRRLRDFIEAQISTIWLDNGHKNVQPVIFAGSVERLDNTSCFACPGISAETALISLDLAGIALSSGSACSSGKVSRSHVLSAMGADDEIAKCALRISLGPENDHQQAQTFVDALRKIASHDFGLERAAARV